MKNIIKFQNKTIKIVKTNELLKYDLKKPNIQRILNKKKVDDIINYQLNQLKNRHNTNFLGLITINYCNLDKKYYLIDGQHRYRALLELYENYSHNVDICIEIVNVNNFEELKENYNIINNNTPLPEFSVDIDKIILEETLVYFQDKYPNIWSKSIKSHRPLISFNNFQESLNYIIEKLDIKDSKTLINYIENYNLKLSENDISKYTDITKNQFDKAKRLNFYLGLFSHTSNNEYGYTWVKEIVDKYFEEYNNKIKKKTNIPKKLRDDLWNKLIGKSIGGAYCLICNNEKIYMNKFEAGHIISEKDGGTLSLDNLLPICPGCNRSMSSKNLNEWINEFYPENLERFNKREYRLICS